MAKAGQGAQEREAAKYYIGGRQYIPDKSVLLCVWDNSKIMGYHVAKLYRTQKGAFFLVTEQEGNTSVELLDDKKAMQFMDSHTAGIITENYDKSIGVPEMG